MIAFPNCKINIGLYITGKRPDGYHNLQTVFFPLAINDIIEIIDNKDAPEIGFTSSGLPVDGSKETNLCIKALALLQKDYTGIPPVKMHLHKTIPVGAGLGGGSADAAFTLQLLNKKYKLSISRERLMEYALALGSDCPFFLHNHACVATGRGEMLKTIQMDLSGYTILLVNPGIHINTGWAFRSLQQFSSCDQLEEKILEPVHRWKETIYNSFEAPVFEAYPEIASIKSQLYESGALYASMSGSGSSVYGIFEKGHKATLNFPPHYFHKWV